VRLRKVRQMTPQPIENSVTTDGLVWEQLPSGEWTWLEPEAPEDELKPSIAEKLLTQQAADFIADTHVPLASIEDGKSFARRLGYLRWLEETWRIDTRPAA